MRSFTSSVAGAMAAMIMISGPAFSQGAGPDLEGLLALPQIPPGQAPSMPPAAEADFPPRVQNDVTVQVPEDPTGDPAFLAPITSPQQPATEAVMTPDVPLPEEPVMQNGGPAVDLDLAAQNAPAPGTAVPDDPVAAMHQAYAGIRADIFVVYEEGNKIAWKGDVACVMRLSGWKPWSSGKNTLTETADACREISEELRGAEAYDGEFSVAMDRGTIKVSQEIGSGDRWQLFRFMTCGLDGTPIATLLEGYADTGKQKININTPRAFSVQAATGAEQECLAALKSAL